MTKSKNTHLYEVRYTIAIFLTLHFGTVISQNSLDSKTKREQPYPEERTFRATRYHTHIQTNFALIAGMWIPTGGAVRLGIHPELGLQLGAKFNKNSIDGTIAFKFGHATNQYYARRWDGTIQLTNYFFGGYVGLDYRREVFRRNDDEVSFLAGIALDGFDTGNTNVQSISILVPNFNIGVGYRHYYQDGVYVGVNLNYHFVDYTGGHVIDFTGNPVTIRFVFGGLGR